MYWTMWVVLTVLNLGLLIVSVRMNRKSTETLGDCRRLIGGPWKQATIVGTLDAVLNAMSESRASFIRTTGAAPSDSIVKVYDDFILSLVDLHLAEEKKLEGFTVE